jgi:hypothetical protein
MYLRETKRTNRDGGTVSCLQLAHNRRDPQTGVPKAEIIHSFGRADHIDREGLAWLVRSISRFLEPGEAVAAATGDEVEVVDCRPMGGALVLDHLWRPVGIDQSLTRLLAGRKLDPKVERVLFTLVANRALEPLSKLASTQSGIPHDEGFRGTILGHN